MKKIYLNLTIIVVLLSTVKMFGKGENPELIRDRLEAQNFYNNLKIM